MAFHVACPLTCRKVCNCTLGSSGHLRKLGGREMFLRNAHTLQKLLGKSPLMITTGEDSVEVLAPRLSKEPKKKKKKAASSSAAAEADLDAEADVEEPEEAEVEAEAEPEEIPAAAASTPAPAEEEQLHQSPEPKRLEAEFENVAEEEPSIKADEELPPDEAPESSSPPQVEEEPGVPPEDLDCGFCLQSEISGSKKHSSMLSCEGCQRVFHRKCLKSWAEHRDLFNWASWRCVYCRTCEDCKAAGDPNKSKLMFCKRCDEAHHFNCKQTGVKASTTGPFLCSKHAQCHSCGARVPGGGSSSRWSHSYLFCDACGRLFSKNRYCPICLKVYRETEPAPMVQCDVCQHWLHCVCEGISEEKYQEFQANSDLKFTCAACRKECFKATSLDDAIAELWRRKDETDVEEISKARASAGFPSESEMAELYPSSSDEEQPAPAPVKEPTKREGKLLIKLSKKPAPDQKPASTPRANKSSRGVKPREEAQVENDAGHEVSKRFSKKRKQAGDDPKPRDEKQASASGTKITLRVPARRQAEAKEQTAPSEDTKEEQQQQSDDETLQSENRRKRLPSSKYRDIASPAAKKSRLNEEGDVSKKKKAPVETPAEPEAEKKPLKLKFRKQEVEAPAPRGQRSKRKRPSASHEDEPPAEEEAEAESDEDDSSILQRLGLDAVTKRVEVRRSDKSWLKGTISSVNQRRSQFTLQFDNGDKKTQKYGKDKIRLLGKK